MKINIRKKKDGSKKSEKQDDSVIARVTDANLEEYKKDIIQKGKRFIKPVHTSRRKIVRNSLIVAVLVIVLMISSVAVSIYRYNSTSGFIYQVSRIIPFPAARVNGDFVEYWEYLFIVKFNENYLRDYEFNNGEVDQSRIDNVRSYAFHEAKKNTVLHQEARKMHISVSNAEIESQLSLLESFAGSDKRRDDIIREYYGIEAGDLAKLIEVQLLKTKLAPLISIDAKAKIEEAKQALSDGTSFADVVKNYSEDANSVVSGGSLGVVDPNSTDLPQSLVEAGMALGVGEYSDIVLSDSGFHVMTKLADNTDGKAELGHIFVYFSDVDDYLENILDEATVTDYIHVEDTTNL